MRSFCRLAVLSVCAFLLAAPAAGQSRMKQYKSRYYDVHTDLGAEIAREIILRADEMVEEYAGRTRGFARQLTRRLPLYVFSDARHYQAAGALPGSGGTFVVDGDGDARLLVLAGREPHAGVWVTLQHEGFHQFVHAVIGGDIPMWVNEGLADYFGAGLFTGDDYITGVVPPNRVQYLQGLLRSGQARPLRQMMLTDADSWNARLAQENYVQAWSMVHFLAHADPRYEKAFNHFIREVSRGLSWETAWKNSFGGNVEAFEQRWRDYWLAMPVDASRDLYARAVVATMTGYYGRAMSQRQRFESVEQFFLAAREGKLRAHSTDWLPDSLLEETLPVAQRMGTWQLDARQPRVLHCTLADGTILSGVFELTSGRMKPNSVQVAVRPAARTNGTR